MHNTITVNKLQTSCIIGDWNPINHFQVNPLSCKIIGGKAVFAPSISKENTHNQYKILAI